VNVRQHIEAAITNETVYIFNFFTFFLHKGVWE
jgi:hypothetical protein